MNEQNNNSQNNNLTPKIWTSGPAQNVRSRLMDEVAINPLDNVGTLTTNHASNKVISWGVGNTNNVNDNKDVQSSTVTESLFDDDMINQVNADVITDNETLEPEVLDDEFLGVTKKFEPIKQPEPSAIFEPIKQPEPKNVQGQVGGPLPFSEISPNSQNSINNEIQQPIFMSPNGSNDWMNQQPLSGGQLGVNTIDSSASAKDVVKKGKFFSGSVKQPKNKIGFGQPKFSAPVIKKDMGLDDPIPNVDETQMLKNYVRYDFSKINMSIFSFSALIFKGAFLINRKMYLLGIVELLAELYILTQLPIKIALIIYAVWSIVFALIANPLYLLYAKIKVKVMKNAKKNRKKNQVEFNKMCMKIGGDNTVLAIIAEFLFLAGLVYLSMYEFPNSVLHQGYDFAKNYIEEQRKPVYDGVIDRVKFNVDDNLEINIPSNFSKAQGLIYKYIFAPSGHEERKVCELTISSMNKFSDAQDFMKQYKEYEKIGQDIVELKTDDFTWYSLDHEKKNYLKKMNATTLYGKAVLVEFNIGKEVEAGVCEYYYTQIFNSIKIKEEN